MMYAGTLAALLSVVLACSFGTVAVEGSLGTSPRSAEFLRLKTGDVQRPPAHHRQQQHLRAGGAIRLRGGVDSAVEVAPEDLGERIGIENTTRYDSVDLFTFHEASATWLGRSTKGSAEIVQREGRSALIRFYTAEGKLTIQQEITGKMDFHGLATTDRLMGHPLREIFCPSFPLHFSYAIICPRVPLSSLPTPSPSSPPWDSVTAQSCPYLPPAPPLLPLLHRHFKKTCLLE